MKRRHIGAVSKYPSQACQAHMDGTLKGRANYKFCDKGKIDPPS